MPLSVGDKLGPYEIISLIGKGGMGEVYSAHDPRTGRDVAIKVSAERFNERFDREVRAVAALNHPNICTLFDVGPNYLVMELVEGESPQGPMPFDTAINYARQIAAALEEAHEKGVVHRDLKPSNIKIKPDGTVKVLDFGLAKMGTPATQSENSPTISMAATQAGMILGTAAYMAPEQAKGKPVDKRADIWAFGVVLHEMLTGERLFQHDDLTETLAAVVLKAPELERAPVEVRRLLKKCLEKDPKKRLRDIGDAWELLETEPARAPEIPQPAKAHVRWLPWAILSGVLFLALAAALAWIFRPSPAPTITRFPISLGEGQQFTTNNHRFVAISPDGTQFAYVANVRLYLRSMSDLTARAIPGTDAGGAISNPAFSPDGKSLVFYANVDRTLKKVAVSGGAAVTICPIADIPLGVTWGPDGIVFAQPNKGIFRVSPNGGTPELLVAAKESQQFEGAQMLPGGKAILMTVATGAAANAVAWDKARIVVQTLKSGALKTVVEGGSDAHYLPTGHLVYSLGGVLFAAPFDLGRLETTSGPVSIVEGVSRVNTGSAQFAFSNSGSLIYVPGPVSGLGIGNDVLALVDPKGQVEPLNLPPSAYDNPRVTRDGKRVAYQIDDGKELSIWVYDLSGGAAPRRLTLPGTGSNRDPVWSADGERVTFQSDREGDLAIWWQRADGSSPAERLTKPDKGESHRPSSWSRDGQTLLFDWGKAGTAAVRTFSLRDKKSTVFAEVPSGFAGRSEFSPDGHWVAYSASDQRVYVQPFPPTGAKYQAPQVRDDHHPLWSPDGKELFYIPGNRRLVSVTFNTQPTVSFGTPVEAPRSGFETRASSVPRNFDILPNGKFIGVVAAGQTQTGSAAPQIQVVLNWFEDVKQRAPGH